MEKSCDFVSHAWYVLRYAGRKVILGIDRLDYMKGIPHKLMAFGCFLEHHPDWVTLLQGNVCNKNKDGSSARSGGSKYGVGLGFSPAICTILQLEAASTFPFLLDD